MDTHDQKAQQQENRATADRRGSRSLSETAGVEIRQSEDETQQQLPILVVDRRTRSMKTAIVFAQTTNRYVNGQCFPNKRMVILVDFSAIFLASPVVNFWHAFPMLLSLFRAGPNRFAALLPQSGKTFRYHNDYRMLRSFVRTLPFKFHQVF